MSTLYDILKEQLNREQGVAVATIVEGPDHLGAKLLVLADKTVHGTLGLAELDSQVIDDAEQAIWHSTAHIHAYTLAPHKQVYAVFIEGFSPPPQLIIVGAGHIAIPLTALAKTLGYHVVVIDARAAFATPERFPHADELIVAWPDEVLTRRLLYPSTSVAVLTHDPKFDEPTLKVVLGRQVGYVGAIGSHKTSQERAERLKNQGLTAAQLQHIHGPIGLAIGATSPAEIALAIMAEIVATHHGKTLSPELPWHKN